jgi:hypothetical protein
VARLIWFILAAVLVLAGVDLLVRDWLGLAGWIPIGVGVGIGASVAGSLLYDALVGPLRR